MAGELFKGEVALFSGRFDIPTGFHWITVLRLLNNYGFDKVSIIILDYPERKHWPVCMAEQFFKELILLSGLRDRVYVKINTTHFGKITKEELDQFDSSVYVSGNKDVLRNIYSLGFPCLYVEPSYDTHASGYIYKND